MVAELGRGCVALADTELVEVSAVRKSPMVVSMLRQAQQPQEKAIEDGRFDRLNDQMCFLKLLSLGGDA